MNEGTKNSIEAKIIARYSNSTVTAKRKNVSFNVDEELLERLDSVVNVFNQRDGVTNRNAVIEDAIKEYVSIAEDYFDKQNENNDTTSETIYDTAVFPALNDNFANVFIAEHKWYWVRLAPHRVPNIKYIALYRGAPTSAITHYAEVNIGGISDPDPMHSNKRCISFSEPIALKNPVHIGEANINSVRKLFYTTLEKLQSVNKIEDLIK